MQQNGLDDIVHNTLKINVASELHADMDRVGVGWVLSKEDGSVLHTKSILRQTEGGACLAELEAVK